MELTFSVCAYCQKSEESWHKLIYFKCDSCQKKVHYECVHSPQPSPLQGDAFFKFKCQSCGEYGKEEFVRNSMSWHNVVMLALYNLHKTSQGRCGYFHWKVHIGGFIDQHWNTLFGYQRKKTNVWLGTIAGTLSSGCPAYFLSGTQVGQQGHWRLANVEPPNPNVERKKPTHRKKKVKEIPVNLNPDIRKCRRSSESALTAAVELKEKRSTLTEPKLSNKPRIFPEDRLPTLKETDQIFTSSKVGTAKAKVKKSEQRNLLIREESNQSSDSLSLNCSTEVSEEAFLSDSQISVASSELSLATHSSYSSSVKSYLKEEDTSAHLQVNHFEDLISMVKDDNDDFDLQMVVSENSVDPRPLSPDMDIMLSTETVCTSYEVPGKSPVLSNETPTENVKQEPKSDTESECPSEKFIKTELDSDGEESGRAEQDSGEEDEDLDKVPGKKREIDGRKRSNRPLKRRKVGKKPQARPAQQLKRISLFEEGELLKKLNDAAAKQTLPPELAQIRRKLICNQTNREFGLPVFDLDNLMDKLAKHDKSVSQVSSARQQSFFHYPSTRTAETRDLDRFMIHKTNKKLESRNYTSFYQRLVGFTDEELTPVVSPYTTRVLLPFIWRNVNPSSKPLKLRLLQEIQAFPHRNDPSWVQPPSPSIDYCYIRPEHVPSVNALCREFFWPGIDVSECLQYPDFSCIVLYRKIVIAFAFMVPDRGYNEAYISFIFTHPEWRGAGIATFMLYHLIQTCMGKDVLLHVSVTNPAMLLYQKFGFKCQELILNFYYKYFPLNSKESTHAFLMRLSR